MTERAPQPFDEQRDIIREGLIAEFVAWGIMDAAGRIHDPTLTAEGIEYAVDVIHAREVINRDERHSLEQRRYLARKRSEEKSA